MKWTVAILVLLCSAYCSGQTTTEEEPVQAVCDREQGNDNPMIVPDLPVCSDIRDMPQCCSRDYILQRLNISEEYFRMALREELQRRFDLFRQIARRIREFLDSDFLDGLFRSFADLSYLGNRASLVGQFSRELRDHLDIDVDRDRREGRDEFRVRELLERLVDRVKDDAAEEYGSVLGVQQCIRDLIQEKVSAARMEAFAAAVEQIRRVRSSLDRLADFLDNLNSTLSGFRPLQVCVDRLVELNDCGSCVIARRPLCGNVCGALARACYSPFYDAFNGQFERFWMVAREIVSAAGTALVRLNQNRRIIGIGRLELAAQALSQCRANFTFPDFPVGKRQADDDDDDDDDDPRVPDIPSFVRGSISALTGGAFDYEGTGPRLCRAFVQTSPDRCWDGRRQRPADIARFIQDRISGQDDNPVIQIDTSLLQQQSNALGSPVDTFLQDPSFAEVTPEGLVIPNPDGGSVKLMFTFSTLLLAVLAAFSFN